MEKFLPYLEVIEIEVDCDHASLAWMFATVQAPPCVRHWLLCLQGFHCKIKHHGGKANIPVEALSHHKHVTATTEAIQSNLIIKKLHLTQK